MKSNALATVLALTLLGTGCSRSDPAAAAPTTAKPAEQRYALRGEVIAVDTVKKTLTVKHEAVGNYMPAMTMDFDVSAGDAAVAKPGQRIRAEMIPSQTSNFRLEKIWPDDKVAAETVAAVANALRQDTHNRGKEAYREIGEAMPNFALYDQEGRVVQSARFRGKQIMLNFIYSRCPVLNMCPASTLKMMQVQKSASEAGANLELVSITLEPSYDTPGVLKDYALARGIDTTNFSFLTGPQSAIDDLLTQFGVIAEFKTTVPQHTLSTLLINESGKIVHRADGPSWDPAEFVARMKK